jgi:ribosome-binding ATPase
MGLSCGRIGVPLCGKTTIFNAVTALDASSYNSSEMNRAIINIPDRRLNRLADMYHPQKIVPSTLDIVDIPGLGSSTQGDGRGLKLLGHIKDVEALLHVVRCFSADGSSPETIEPVKDIDTVELELLAADSTTLENKLHRLEKRVRAGDKDAIRETTNCKKVFDAIQQGIAARKQELNDQELSSIRECNLVSLKPVLYIANIASMDDAETTPVLRLKEIALNEGAEMITICGKDEADIAHFGQNEQREFLQEMGLKESSMERLLLSAYKILGLISFFTVGEDEVRAWTCRKGDKAPTAAGKIHTDMEKGFIRMEVMSYENIVEMGSEAAVAKAGLQRLEGREYEVRDGDIATVRFNRKG